MMKKLLTIPIGVFLLSPRVYAADGVADNFLETGNDFAFDYNIGVFLKKDF